MHSVFAQLIWTFFPLCVRGDQKATLTTAIIWNNPVSIKPTATYKIIPVDTFDGTRPRFSPDFFHEMKTKDLRRQSHGDGDLNGGGARDSSGDVVGDRGGGGSGSKSGGGNRGDHGAHGGGGGRHDSHGGYLRSHGKHGGSRHGRNGGKDGGGGNFVWESDYWCQLQPQKGNCTKEKPRYYYSASLGTCKVFYYSGCSGNQNNFKSLAECERNCKGAPLMQTKHIARTMSCSLQPNSGLCLALFDKFYYDVNERACKMFVYGGCGGNQNRFSSKHQCQETCVQ